MKILKTLTIVSVTGLAGLTALQACPMNQGERSCQGMKQSEVKGCKGSKYHKKGHPMMKLYSQLDLTEEQKEQMKVLRQEMQAQREAKKKDRSKRGMGMMVNFVSEKGFDKEGFIKMATQKSQEKIQMRAAMFEKRMNILTPEQRTKLIELMQAK
jgi:protein CpxP